GPVSAGPVSAGPVSAGPVSAGRASGGPASAGPARTGRKEVTTMTNGDLTMSVRKFRLGPSQRIMLLTAILAAAAVALFVIVVRPLPAAPTALNLPWVLWAGAFA